MALYLTFPKQFYVNSAGQPYPAAKMHTYRAGTTTNLATYTTATLGTPHANPVVADSNGIFPAIYVDPNSGYDLKVVLKDQADVPLYTEDNIPATPSNQAQLGEILYPRTAAEIAAGVTPTYYYYEPGNVKRYGALGDGTTDDTAAIQAAIDVGYDVIFPQSTGDYRASGLTQDTPFQKFYAQGWARVRKNANGSLFTSTANYIELNGISFAGDASSPTYTGDGLVLDGADPRLINCGCRWISGVPVKATGDGVQIVGTCDIYQTTDGTASGYDIQIGESGTATLYHRIIGVRSSQATGGIKFIDCGSQAVEASQFGKLTVAAGTSPAGVNGGNYTTNRILGDVDIDISNSAFAANTIGTATVTFASGTSGHSFDGSNVLASGATLVDDSNLSVVVDSRLSVMQAYTPAWTAASVNPAIGNGTITGYYQKIGRRVDVSVRIVMGSTTTYGTGVWYVSLPVAPNTSILSIGTAIIFDSGATLFTSMVQSLTDGTARCVIYSDGSGQLSATVPITWATSDELRFSLSYWAAT